MKKIISTFAFVLVLLSLNGQTLIEKFRSESGERWFNLRELASRSRGAVTNDFNDNGVQEVIYRDSLFFRFVELGSSTTEYQFEAPAALTGSKGDYFWGSVDIDGSGLAEIVVRKEQDIYILQLNESTEKATISQIIDSGVGFFDVDGDQLVDVIQYDASTRQTVVLGVPNPDGFTGAPQVNNSVKSNQDFMLTKKYQGAEGFSLFYPSNLLSRSSDWDLNGDGVIELILLKTDTLDVPIGFRVVNGISKEISFTFPLPEEFQIEGLTFIGFFDVDGENGKEFYLSNGAVIEQDKTIHLLPESFQIFGFLDIDNDGLQDIIGQDTVANSVQVWGSAATTPVDEAVLQRIGLHMDPAFPNPMTTHTTIPFQLSEKSHVQLQILSMDGRLIKTLVDDVLQKGDHVIRWEEEQLPTGTYLYKLQANNRILTQKLIKH